MVPVPSGARQQRPLPAPVSPIAYGADVEQDKFDRRTVVYLPDSYSRLHRSRPFVKLSRGGDTRLVLYGQNPDAPLPVYGIGAAVEGCVEFKSRPVNVTSVEVKVSITTTLCLCLPLQCARQNYFTCSY
jgi:hypothetical protein